ncbi:hypothetical protein [Plesiomonas shigelloides]|uniref:hypothetical protein n=1 Tax=Plesiomonas shigelloides TaxID=703 RepID=UPI0015B6B637|nr:hypothetical protein [Plesiomonas shigelloides]
MSILDFSLLSDSRVISLMDQDESIISVHEYETVSYKIVSDELLQPTLLLGDYSLRFEKHYNQDGYHVYESIPSQAFRNFVGITHAEIVNDSNANTEIIAISRPINVYASKISYERALNFLRYIISKEDISSTCFSVTKGGSEAQCSSNNLSEKLIAGLRAVEYLNNEWGRFHHDPCVKNSSKSVIRPFSRSMPVDDRTIAYLSMHPDSLTRTDAQSGDVLIRGQHYAIQHIITNEIKQNLNVFENQVILYFLKSFYQFIILLKSELSTEKSNSGVLSVNGIDYISLDQVLRDSGIFISFQQEKLDISYASVRLALSRLQRDFKCVLDKSKNLLPTPTQQVLSKSHYMALYKFMDEYYKIGEPSWRGTSELYGIRNISKLYEFVALINIHQSLSDLNFSLNAAKYLDIDGVEISRPLNEPCNVYTFKHPSGLIVKLLYDIQTGSLEDLSNPVLGKLYDMKHKVKTRTWRPDFQIRVSGDRGVECHILDAKYSNRKTVNDRHIPECARKYGLETRMYNIVGGEPKLTVPDSVTIIYSGESTPYISLYRAVSSSSISNLVANSKPQIGSIGSTEGDIKQLTALINKLISKSINIGDTLVLHS